MTNTECQATPRTYTIAEIDDMRMSVRYMLRPTPGTPYYSAELDETIERRLRTYMIAGVSPEELYANAGGRMYEAR